MHLSPWRRANPPDCSYICLTVWRKDGFISLEVTTEGRRSTVPITFTGSHLLVRAWTQFGGELAFELALSSGEFIPSFTFEDNDPVSGDAPAHVVTWRGRSDVSQWAGREVRLRMRMRRARIYALQFVESTLDRSK
jgi:hypothetical protein